MASGGVIGGFAPLASAIRAAVAVLRPLGHSDVVIHFGPMVDPDAGVHLIPSVVRFDVFEVDVQAAELKKRGRKIKLQDQPFRVLIMPELSTRINCDFSAMP